MTYIFSFIIENYTGININNTLFSDNLGLIIFGISLFIFLIFNFFNQMFMGDNGTYILAMIFGFNLIDIYNNNKISHKGIFELQKI